MGKYLVLWDLDPSKIPVDPQERGAAWKVFMSMVKQDLETGTAVDWGGFVGEGRGYAVHEGSEVEVAVALQQYVPFVNYVVHPISTVSQVEQLIEALIQ